MRWMDQSRFDIERSQNFNEKGDSYCRSTLIDIKKHYIRHDACRLSEMIINLVSERKNACNKKENFFRIIKRRKRAVEKAHDEFGKIFSALSQKAL